MENAEEILQCLDEFTKLRPKEIPPELEYYLSFVARTGDPVYQWPLIKCLFREKLINVITEFYETCPSVEIPPCPNVEIFNYEAMKGFILEKLDTFAAAPFTVQRICELLTSPRKEYNRIDKYMRALEKNILVVSTREPGNRKSTENGESVVNGLETEHGSQEMVNSLNSDINVEVDMDEKTVWHKTYAVNESNIIESHASSESIQIQESYVSESKTCNVATTTTDSVITTRQINYIGYTNEMLVEPSTNATEDVTPDNSGVTSDSSGVTPDNSGVPTVFTLSRTDKEDEQGQEQIYVTTEEGAFIKADCSDMETSQILSETETEPITPPEPEVADKTEQPESSVVEAVVESSSESQEQPEVTESTSNETTITSSDEAQQKPETEEETEITASDHQEVTESNIVIGPEDMQVEDISPEPETQLEPEALAPAPSVTVETSPQIPEVTEEKPTEEVAKTEEVAQKEEQISAEAEVTGSN